MTDSPQPPVPSSPEQIARIRKSRNTVLGLLLGLRRLLRVPRVADPEGPDVVVADDGARLHVELDGDPAADVTVVFVHGFTARLEEFFLQREALRGRARLVLYDQRGHGRSGWGDVRGATIDQLGRDLAAVLDRWAPPALGGAGTSGPELALVPAAGHLGAGQIEGLAELRTPDGGSLLTTFISSFTRRADDRLEVIRACVARSDDEALAMAAHEPRGSAATIGAVRVASLCAELEHGGSAVLGGRPGMLDDLATELGQVLLELDAIAGRAA